MKKWISLLLVSVLALGILAMPAAAASAPAPSYRFTVVFASATLPANADAIISRAGGQVESRVPELGVMAVTGPASLMASLNRNAAILTASPSIEFQLDVPNQAEATDGTEAVNTATADLYNRYQWDIKQVTNNGASWAISTGSHNTVVGIIDTGVSTQHPALKANLLGGQNFVPDSSDGTVVSTDIEDRHGHGSHVAGNIAGNGRILGIGPDLGFRSYRVFGATGGSPSDRIISAMVAAVQDKVDVISMSLGGFDTLTPYTWTDPATGTVYKGSDVADFVAYRRAVKYAVERGVVVVAAAGNDAIDITNPVTITAFLNAEYGSDGYAFKGASREVPGTLPGVITVSATGPDKSLASYSNYGPGAIDVSAPGGDFRRYGRDADWFTDLNLSSYKNGGYVWMAGTSMATPKVAAVAALIIDQAKAGGQTLTPSQVESRLLKTSVDEGKPGYDAYFGQGMASAYTALGGN